MISITIGAAHVRGVPRHRLPVPFSSPDDMRGVSVHSFHLSASRLAALAFFFVCALSSSVAQARPAHEAAVTALPKDWDTFSADITMRHDRLSPDGKTVGVSAPESTFRFERTRSGDRWKTAIVVLSTGPIRGIGGRDTINSRTHQAQVGMRIEDAGDGSPLRIVDGLGKEVRLPQGKSLAPLLEASALVPVAPPPSAEMPAPGVTPVRTGPGRAWVDGFVIATDQHDSRVRVLESSHGRRRDQVRGLDRYVAERDGGASEVWVEPSSVLPVEMNVTENGVLVTHATYEYAPYGPQLVVRKRIRFERLVPGGTGEHSVTVMDVNNVRFERRGGRR